MDSIPRVLAERRTDSPFRTLITSGYLQKRLLFDFVVVIVSLTVSVGLPYLLNGIVNQRKNAVLGAILLFYVFLAIFPRHFLRSKIVIFPMSVGIYAVGSRIELSYIDIRSAYVVQEALGGLLLVIRVRRGERTLIPVSEDDLLFLARHTKLNPSIKLKANRRRSNP